MRARSLALSALCLALLVAGVWWSLVGEEEAGSHAPALPTVASSGGHPGADPSPAPSPREEGSRRVVEATEVDAPGPPDYPRAEGIEDHEGLLVVRVVARETGEEVDGGRVLAREWSGNEVAAGEFLNGTARHRWGAGQLFEDGGRAYPLRAGGPVALYCQRLDYAEPEEGGFVHVPALLPRERRVFDLSVPTVPDLLQYVRIVDAADGRPLPSALVRTYREHVRKNSSGEKFTDIVYGDSLLVDALGFVMIEASTWGGVSAEADAEGYGARLFPITYGHRTPDTALVVRLGSASTLRGRILELSGLPAPGVRVRVTTNSYALRTAVREWRLSAAVSATRSWFTDTAPDGTFQLEGLPPAVPLHAEIQRDRTVLRKGTGPLLLKPGEVREVEWCFGIGCTLHGLVQNAEGNAVAYLEISLARGAGDIRFRADEDLRGTSRTDREGRFVFQNLDRGRWRVGPRAVAIDPEWLDHIESIPGFLAWSGAEPEYRGHSVPIPRTASVEIVPGVPEEHVTLRLQMGFFVRGHVLNPDGEVPREGTAVVGVDAAGDLIHAVTNGAGIFALAPLSPGTVHLTATSSLPGLGPSAAVPAAPGDRGVVLHLTAEETGERGHDEGGPLDVGETGR